MAVEAHGPADGTAQTAASIEPSNVAIETAAGWLTPEQVAQHAQLEGASEAERCVRAFALTQCITS
jgi:hypothetical protein